MSTYVIERVEGATHPLCYRVSHYATNDPQPTPTSDRQTLRTLPDAMTVAFGKAAKQSVILHGRPVTVKFDREYVVTAAEVK